VRKRCGKQRACGDENEEKANSGHGQLQSEKGRRPLVYLLAVTVESVFSRVGTEPAW
jgi:hypothetical protein